MTRVEMTERLPSSSLYAMDEILQAFPWSWTAGQLDSWMMLIHWIYIGYIGYMDVNGDSSQPNLGFTNHQLYWIQLTEEARLMDNLMASKVEPWPFPT